TQSLGKYWGTFARPAVRYRRRSRTMLILHILAGLTLALAALPLGYLILRAIEGGAETFAYLLSARTLTVVGNSVALAFAVAITAALIGVRFAWLTTCTDLPFRRLWLILGLLPMVIPSYIGAVIFIAAFGP